MKRKKDLVRDEEEVIDAEEEGLIAERWSLTKIIIGTIALLFILGAASYGFLFYKRYQESQGKNILGISQTKQEQLPTEDDVEKTLDTVQKEIEKIDPGNLFSSQESIQKIIKDLESLRQNATDPKGAFCSSVCGAPSAQTQSTATEGADTEE